MYEKPDNIIRTRKGGVVIIKNGETLTNNRRNQIYGKCQYNYLILGIQLPQSYFYYKHTSFYLRTPISVLEKTIFQREFTKNLFLIKQITNAQIIRY